MNQNFLNWLKSIDSEFDWQTCFNERGIEGLETILADRISMSGYVNVQSIFQTFNEAEKLANAVNMITR